MLKRKLALITLLAASVGGSLNAAGTLNPYATGDVLICFRNPVGFDMVVDAGPYTTFTSLSVNQRLTISAYNGNQLAQVGTNGTYWSAFTWLADNTLYITKPRVSLAQQTTPWVNKTGGNYTAARMNSIIVGVNTTLYTSLFDSSSVKIEEDNSVGNPNYPTQGGSSYRDAIFGSGGQANFYTTFQGVPENTTPGDFTDAGVVQRSDFYRVDPINSGDATYLGYFELNTNGVMTYVAYPSATPVVKSFNRSGNDNTIVYKTGLYGTYTLCATNSAGLSAPKSTWPAIATLTSGNTSQHQIIDTTTDTNRFYILKAQ